MIVSDLHPASVESPARPRFPPLIFSLLALVLGGCATNSIESRKQERYSAYATLSPETRTLVDAGKIQVGMSPDAVYIAWGKPSQILEHQSPAGTTITWLYHGSHFQEYRYWTQRSYRYGDRYFTEPYLQHDYHPRSYVQAEVHFENGKVTDWRTLPQPAY